ncbi:MAG: hypothetical protein ACLGHN_09620 [Bacteriovoracia bacterium]
MTRCLFLLLCVSFSLPSFSGQIEIAQWLPWKFISNNFIPKTLDHSFSQNNLSFEAGEFRPQISFDVNIHSEGKDIIFTEEGIEASHLLTSTIFVRQLTIDQVIVRVVNGNVFRVHITAACTPFAIHVNEMQTEAQLLYKEDGNIWVPQLAAFDLQIPEWELGNIQCSGIGGVGNEIREQLISVLSHPAMFRNLLKEVMADQLNQYFYSSWDSLIASTGNDLVISGMGHPTAKGVTIYAHLQGSKNISLKTPDESLLSTEVPQLVFSQEGFETLLKDKINETIPKNHNLQNVRAFSKLMSSRFMQYFVWPDLARFPTRTPFYFSTIPEQSQLILRPASGNSYQAYFNTNASLTTIMGGSIIEYLQLGLGMQTNLNVKVSDGQLRLKTASANLTLAWSYGLLYQMIFRPKGQIATDIMLESMNSLFSNQSASHELPSIKIENKVFRLQNWKQNREIITMDWL